ncbi:MAG: glycosyltransferase [Rhodothermales bacterium]|nr:glycosyltransferase [Rhodothermales bacterium]
MRILHAYPEFISKGGRPHDCRQIVNHIARRGHAVCAVAVERPEDHGRILPDDSVTVRFASPVIGSTSFTRILKEFQPDFVHFTGGPRIPVQNGWAFQTRRQEIPYAVSACGNLSEPTYYHRWGNKTNRFYHPLLKRLFFRAFDYPMIRKAAFVHATSDNESRIATRYGAQSTCIVPFGIDDAWVRKTHRPIKPTSLPLTFTYLGRLSIIHKGLDTIVDAFGILQQKGLADKVRLVFAGTSENTSLEHLQRRAAHLQVSNIEFPGGVWSDAKDELWNSTHYFLHMCRFNGFALATREALGQGIPIIATIESDFGDWVNKYGMGSVAEHSAESLADTIISFIEDPGQYAKMVEGVRSYVADTAWQNVADQLIATYAATTGNDDDLPRSEGQHLSLSA